MEVVSRPCPLCREVSIQREKRVHHDVQTGDFTLYECEGCAAQYWLPLKNPGAQWYERDVRYADRNLDPILFPNEKHTFTFRYFGKRKQFKVLDVGCGVGNFLGPASSRFGWICWGIDFDADAIRAAKKVFGLENLFVSDLPSFSRKNDIPTFDLVSFFDVFEHIDNHHDFFASVRDLLVPEGHIALSVPYRHGLSWFMPNDVPPRHLTRWDDKSLSKFLAREGFEVVATKKSAATLYFIAMKLRYRFGALFSYGVVQKLQQRGQGVSAGHEEHTTSARMIRVVRRLAKAKDMFIFGLPALCIWAALLFTKKRYTDMTIIAKRR